MNRPSLALLLLLVAPSYAAAQGGQPRPVSATTNSADKIASAISAAPAQITARASILDWPASDGASPSTLRQGTNGWSCFPDYPGTEGNDPMCLDEQWVKFVGAWVANEQPQVTRIGVGYMLAPGGAHGSASDPFATAQTPTNHWGHDGPHLMLVVPDAGALQGLPTSRDNGGPWVMWTGTPYAHIMIPVAEPMAAGKH
jgi:hypothetical protein